jgi:hypothetical protein
MNRLPMLPGRAGRCGSRSEDPRGVAEALYEESLGDDASFMLCELLDLHANRTGQNTARHAGRIFSGAVRASPGADAQAGRVNGLALPKPSDLANAEADGDRSRRSCRHAITGASVPSPLVLQTRIGAAVTTEVCYTFCGKSARMLRLSSSGSGKAMAASRMRVESIEEIGRVCRSTPCTKWTAKYSFSPV